METLPLDSNENAISEIAPLAADGPSEQKLVDFTASMQNVFVEYGLGEEMLEAKKIALADMNALEEGDIYEKVDALAEVFDPITEDLAEMTGKEFVATMSEEAGIKARNVMVMEVPCCSGLVQLVREARDRATKDIPIRCTVVGVQGNILAEQSL